MTTRSMTRYPTQPHPVAKLVTQLFNQLQDQFSIPEGSKWDYYMECEQEGYAMREDISMCNYWISHYHLMYYDRENNGEYICDEGYKQGLIKPQKDDGYQGRIYYHPPNQTEYGEVILWNN